MADGQVIIRIVPDDSQFTRTMRHLATNTGRTISQAINTHVQPLGRITGEANEFQKSLAASNARVIAFGASAGAIYAMRSAFQHLIHSTIEVERQMTEINAIFQLSSANLKRFSLDLFGVANNYSVAFSDATKAAAEFARQGLTVEETLKRTSAALALARIANVNMEQAVATTTSILNTFTKEALQAEEVVNRLAAVDQAYAVSSGDLAEALSRVSSSATDANVSLNETIGLITAAKQITARTGSTIGNSLKTMFTRLQRPQVIEDLEAVGVKARDANGKILPMLQVLRNLAMSYDTLGSSQKSFVAETVGGVYQINTLKAIMKDLGSGLSIVEGAMRAAGQSSDFVQKRMEALNDTISSQLIRTGNNLMQTFANLGSNIFGGSMRTGINNFDALIRKVGKYSDTTTANEGSGLEKFFANMFQGAQKGFGNFLKGPGLQFLMFILLKLFQRLEKFLVDSAKDLININKAEKERQAINAGIARWMGDQKGLLAQILTGQVTLNEAARRYVQSMKDAASAAQDLQRVASAAGAIAGPQVELITMSGTGGRRSASGYIPNLETREAMRGGYHAGRVVNTILQNGMMSVPATVNTNETITTIVKDGLKYQYVNPPPHTAAGQAHAALSQRLTGLNPYATSQGAISGRSFGHGLGMGAGFVPNLALLPSTIQAIAQAGISADEVLNLARATGQGDIRMAKFTDLPENVVSALVSRYRHKPDTLRFALKSLVKKGSGNIEGGDATNLYEIFRGLMLNQEAKAKNYFPDMTGKDAVRMFAESIAGGQIQQSITPEQRAAKLLRLRPSDAQKVFDLHARSVPFIAGYESADDLGPARDRPNLSLPFDFSMPDGSKFKFKIPTGIFGFKENIQAKLARIVKTMQEEAETDEGFAAGEIGTTYGNFIQKYFRGMAKREGIPLPEGLNTPLDIYGPVQRILRSTNIDFPVSALEIKASAHEAGASGHMIDKLFRTFAGEPGTGGRQSHLKGPTGYVPKLANILQFDPNLGGIGIIDADKYGQEDSSSAHYQALIYAAIASHKPLRVHYGPMTTGKTTASEAIVQAAGGLGGKGGDYVTDVAQIDSDAFKQFIINKTDRKHLDTGVFGLALAAASQVRGFYFPYGTYEAKRDEMIRRLRERNRGQEGQNAEAIAMKYTPEEWATYKKNMDYLSGKLGEDRFGIFDENNPLAARGFIPNLSMPFGMRGTLPITGSLGGAVPVQYTEREGRVADLMAQGISIADIARQFNVPRSKIETIRNKVVRKQAYAARLRGIGMSVMEMGGPYGSGFVPNLNISDMWHDDFSYTRYDAELDDYERRNKNKWEDVPFGRKNRGSEARWNEHTGELSIEGIYRHKGEDNPWFALRDFIKQQGSNIQTISAGTIVGPRIPKVLQTLVQRAKKEGLEGVQLKGYFSPSVLRDEAVSQVRSGGISKKDLKRMVSAMKFLGVQDFKTMRPFFIDRTLAGGFIPNLSSTLGSGAYGEFVHLGRSIGGVPVGAKMFHEGVGDEAIEKEFIMGQALLREGNIGKLFRYPKIFGTLRESLMNRRIIKEVLEGQNIIQLTGRNRFSEDSRTNVGSFAGRVWEVAQRFQEHAFDLLGERGIRAKDLKTNPGNTLMNPRASSLLSSLATSRPSAMNFIENVKKDPERMMSISDLWAAQGASMGIIDPGEFEFKGRGFIPNLALDESLVSHIVQLLGRPQRPVAGATVSKPRGQQLGHGANSVFYALRSGVGKKAFHSGIDFLKIAQEYEMSKRIDALPEGAVNPLFSFPKTIGSLRRSMRRRAIGKEVFEGMSLADYAKQVHGPMNRGWEVDDTSKPVGRANMVAEAFKKLAEQELLEQGIKAIDIVDHPQNTLFNAQALSIFNKIGKSERRSNKLRNRLEQNPSLVPQIGRAMARQGARMGIVDPGDFKSVFASGYIPDLDFLMAEGTAWLPQEEAEGWAIRNIAGMYGLPNEGPTPEVFKHLSKHPIFKNIWAKGEMFRSQSMGHAGGFVPNLAFPDDDLHPLFAGGLSTNDLGNLLGRGATHIAYLLRNSRAAGQTPTEHDIAAAFQFGAGASSNTVLATLDSNNLRQTAIRLATNLARTHVSTNAQMDSLNYEIQNLINSAHVSWVRGPVGWGQVDPGAESQSFRPGASNVNWDTDTLEPPDWAPQEDYRFQIPNNSSDLVIRRGVLDVGYLSRRATYRAATKTVEHETNPIRHIMRAIAQKKIWHVAGGTIIGPKIPHLMMGLAQAGQAGKLPKGFGVSGYWTPASLLAKVPQKLGTIARAQEWAERLEEDQDVTGFMTPSDVEQLHEAHRFFGVDPESWQSFYVSKQYKAGGFVPNLAVNPQDIVELLRHYDINELQDMLYSAAYSVRDSLVRTPPTPTELESAREDARRFGRHDEDRYWSRRLIRIAQRRTPSRAGLRAFREFEEGLGTEIRPEARRLLRRVGLAAGQHVATDRDASVYSYVRDIVKQGHRIAYPPPSPQQLIDRYLSQNTPSRTEIVPGDYGNQKLRIARNSSDLTIQQGGMLYVDFLKRRSWMHMPTGEQYEEANPLKGILSNIKAGHIKGVKASVIGPKIPAIVHKMAQLAQGGKFGAGFRIAVNWTPNDLEMAAQQYLQTIPSAQSCRAGWHTYESMDDFSDITGAMSQTDYEEMHQAMEFFGHGPTQHNLFFYDKSFARGFVPNMYNAAQDALNRENRATGGKGKIGRSPFLVTEFNPLGMGAYDTAHQPNIDFAIHEHITKLGQSPNAIRRARTSSKGFVPNLAGLDSYDTPNVSDTGGIFGSYGMVSSLMMGIMGSMRQERNAPSEESDVRRTSGWMKNFTSAGEQAAAHIRLLSREFDKLKDEVIATGTATTSWGQTFSGRKAQKQMDKAFEAQMAPYRALARPHEEGQARQHATLSKWGMRAATWSSMGGGIASQFAQLQSASLGAAINEFTSGATQAGQVLMTFPSKLGVIGAVSVAMGAGISAMDLYAKGIHTAQQAFQISNAKYQKLSAQLDAAANALNQYETMIVDSSVSFDAIQREQRKYAETLAQLSMTPEGKKVAENLRAAPDSKSRMAIMQAEKERGGRQQEMAAGILAIREYAAKRTFLWGASEKMFGINPLGYANKAQQQQLQTMMRSAGGTVVANMPTALKERLTNATDIQSFSDILATAATDTNAEISASAQELIDAFAELAKTSKSAVPAVKQQALVQLQNERLTNDPARKEAEAQLRRDNEARKNRIDDAINQAKLSQRLFVNAGALQGGNALDIQSIKSQKLLGEQLYGPQSQSIARRQAAAGVFRLQYGERTVRQFEAATDLRRTEVERQNRVKGVNIEMSRGIIGQWTQGFEDKIKNAELYRNAGQVGGALPTISTWNTELLAALNKGLAGVVQGKDLSEFRTPQGSVNMTGMIDAITKASGAKGGLEEGVKRYLKANANIDIMKAILDANKQIVGINQESVNKQGEIKSALEGFMAEMDFKQLANHMGGVRTLLDRSARRNLERNLVRGQTLMMRGQTAEARSAGAAMYLKSLTEMGIPIKPDDKTALGRSIKMAMEIGSKNLGTLQQQMGTRVAGAMSRLTGNSPLTQAMQELAKRSGLATGLAGFQQEFRPENEGLTSGAMKDMDTYATTFNTELKTSSDALAAFASSINSSKDQMLKDISDAKSIQEAISEAIKKASDAFYKSQPQPTPSPSLTTPMDTRTQTAGLALGALAPTVGSAALMFGASYLGGRLSRRGRTGTSQLNKAVQEQQQIQQSIMKSAGAQSAVRGHMYQYTGYDAAGKKQTGQIFGKDAEHAVSRLKEEKGLHSTSQWVKRGQEVPHFDNIIKERDAALKKMAETGSQKEYLAFTKKYKNLSSEVLWGSTTKPKSWSEIVSSSQAKKPTGGTFDYPNKPTIVARAREAMGNWRNVQYTPQFTRFLEKWQGLGNRASGENIQQLAARHAELGGGSSATNKMLRRGGKIALGSLAAMTALSMMQNSAQAAQGGYGQPSAAASILSPTNLATFSIDTAFNASMLKTPNMSKMRSVKMGGLMTAGNLATDKLGELIGGKTGEIVGGGSNIALNTLMFGGRAGAGAGIGLLSEALRHGYTEKKFGYGAGLTQGFGGAIASGAMFGGPIGSAIGAGMYLGQEALSVNAETNSALAGRKALDVFRYQQMAQELGGTNEAGAMKEGKLMLGKLLNRKSELEGFREQDEKDFSGVHGGVMRMFSKRQFTDASKQELAKVTRQTQMLNDAQKLGNSQLMLEALRKIASELESQGREDEKPTTPAGKGAEATLNSQIKVDVSVKDYDKIPTELANTVIGPLMQELTAMKQQLWTLWNTLTPHPAQTRR